MKPRKRVQYYGSLRQYAVGTRGWLDDLGYFHPARREGDPEEYVITWIPYSPHHSSWIYGAPSAGIEIQPIQE